MTYMEENKTNINWYPGHMAKTRRMLEENIRNVDAVIEILDARIPFSSRNTDFDDIVSSKPRLILLNKYDLADSRVTDRWISYYQKNSVRVVPISCPAGTGINKITPLIFALVQDKLDRLSEKGVKKGVKVMILGIPNVGKSTLINRLAGKATAKTGDRPGVTTAKQWIRLNGGLELLDTPGILAPKFENQDIALKLAYTGAIRDEVLETEHIACLLLEYLRDKYCDLLCARYKLSDIEDLGGYELLLEIGKKRGCLVSGGEIDEKRASDIVLEDLRSKKIGAVSLETPEEWSLV